MATENVLPRFVVDVTAFADLAKQMRKAGGPLRTDLLRRLRAVGDIVAVDARARAGQVSESVPPSIKVRVRGLTVSVVAGGPGIPMAGLLELGNRDGSGAPERFRAPDFPPKGSKGQEAFVYGGHWQPMHPYLDPAGAAHAVEVERAAVETLDAVFGGTFLTGR